MEDDDDSLLQIPHLPTRDEPSDAQSSTHSVASASYHYDDEISTGLSCTSSQYAIAGVAPSVSISEHSNPSDEDENFLLNPSLPSVHNSFVDYADEDDISTVVPSYNTAGTISGGTLYSSVEPRNIGQLSTGYSSNPLQRRNGDDAMLQANESRFRCVPIWVSNASPAIKFIIVASTALLVGSLVLVSFAAVSVRSQSSDSAAKIGPFTGTRSPTPPPTIRYVGKLTSPPSEDSSFSPSVDSFSLPVAAPSNPPSVEITIASSVDSSVSPSERPFIHPTKVPTYSPTVHALIPTKGGTTSPPTTIVPQSFYVVSKRKMLPTNFYTDNNEGWLVHFGDWQNNKKEECHESDYEKVANNFRNSSIPVFFLPGDNEWIDCGNRVKSRNMWRDNFVAYERNWTLPFTVKRQPIRTENFRFVQRNVLYIGLNIVSDVYYSTNYRLEWNKRLRENLLWVQENVEEFRMEVELLIIFGHSGFVNSVNEPFFTGLAASVRGWNYGSTRQLTVIYIKQGNDSLNSQMIDDEENLKMVNFHSNRFSTIKTVVDTSIKVIKFVDGDKDLHISY